MLATLGYAPVRRAGGLSSTGVRAICAAVVLAACWAGWRFYLWPRFTPGSVRSIVAPEEISRPSPPRPIPIPARPVAPREDTAQPPAPPVLTAEPASQPRVESPRPVPFSTPPARTPSAATSSGAVLRDAARPPAALPVTRAEPAPPRSAVAPASDLDLALYYQRAGDFENALQHYRALLQKNELNAQAHNNLGLLYQEKKLFDESARELQRAILIEPRSVGAHNNYGVTLLLQGKPDEAAAVFRTALKLEPGNVDARVNLALAQRDGGQPQVALETLLGALAIAPRSPAVHYNLAQLYDRASERGRAIEHYRKFLDYAGTEYASRAPAVRSRIDTLSRIPD